MKETTKIKFSWAFLITVLLMVLKVLPDALGYRYFLIDPSSDVEWMSVGLSALSAIICFCVTVKIVMTLKSEGLLESLEYLGFKKPNVRQLLAGLIILVPMAGLFLLLHEALLQKGWPVENYNGLKGYCIKLFFVACILEETIFRGFLFQILRVGRSFWSAAMLSGLLWAFFHITGLIPGYSTSASLILVCGQMYQVVLSSIPAAYLFERGGNNIWGWMLVHAFYDIGIFLTFSQASSNWFFYFYIGFVCLLMAATTSAAVHDLLPTKSDEKNKTWTNTKISQVNIRAKSLGSYLFGTIGIGLAVLFVPPTYDKLNMLYHVNKFEKIVKLHPKNAIVHRNLGTEYFRFQRYEDGAREFQRAVELEPRFVNAWLWWGNSLETMGDHETAIQKFQRAIEIDPQYAPIYISWGIALKSMGKDSEAIAKFQTAVRLNPKNRKILEWAQKDIDEIKAKKNETK